MTQKEALNILKTGTNVFLTGAAGSGKTHLLREYINYLRDHGVDVGITATTGIAATHMGGTTIHSWSGIGIRDFLSPSDIEEISERSYVRERIKNTSVLIIDEISMLHDYRFDMVDQILRAVRAKQEPFGGIQTIVCGDFFQLPPVSREQNDRGRFAYRSRAWRELDFRVCYLEEQHRQNDLQYLSLLNAIRDNSISESVHSILKSRMDTQIKLAFEPTKLYSHNIDVDLENDLELDKLPGLAKSYEMESRGRKNLVEALKKSCLAPEILRIKPNAKVMFVKNNFEEGYANGTLGKVISSNTNSITVKTLSGNIIEVELATWRIEEDGKVLAEIAQFPLRLAWAITVHKSQGMSLDAAQIDLSDSFEKGMGYVALSRVRSLDGLMLKGFNDLALEVHDEVSRVDRDFRSRSRDHAIYIREARPEELKSLHGSFIERVGFADKKSFKKKRKEKVDTLTQTKNLLEQGLNIKEMADMRKLSEETIIGHLEKIKNKDPRVSLDHLRNSISTNRLHKIISAFRKVGVQQGSGYLLSPVKRELGDSFTFDEIRFARLFL